MDNPASPARLKALGYDGPASAEVRQTWLDVAWRALRRELRRLGHDLEVLVATGEVEEADVADVVAASALRVLRNPEGVAKDSGGIDDYTEDREVADASQDVYFTAAELRRLEPVDVNATGGWSGSVQYR